MEINGQTRVAGLIGNPVIYSQSPAMHNAAFKHLNLPAVYLAFQVEEEQVPEAVQAVRALQMIGINVTVPHKEAVVPYLDQLDDTALKCGAVNTIVNQDGKLVGYNTDGLGFLDSLLEAGFYPLDKDVVILGAGGSARAVAVSLLDAQVRSLTLINRTVEKAEKLADVLAAPDKVRVMPLIQSSAPEIEGADLVINTLSVPFYSQDKWLLDLSAARGALFYDLRYGKMPSAFLDYAQTLGSPQLDGLGMLLHQGARAFTLFTGKKAPLEVMRQALLPSP
ncbi:MAG: shikimate dehydrogenase [Firmicutes bacterium]|nr:shikimate dehydrogenase [Bacillota bacterium]